MFNLEMKITWKELAPSLQSMFKTLQSQITDNRQEIDKINNDIDSIYESLDKINLEIDQINNNIDNIYKTVEQINQEINKINNDINSIKDAIDRIDSEIDKINSDINIIYETLNKLNQEIESIRNDIDNIKNDLQNQINEINNKINNLDLNVTYINNQLSILINPEEKIHNWFGRYQDANTLIHIVQFGTYLYPKMRFQFSTLGHNQKDINSAVVNGWDPNSFVDCNNWTYISKISDGTGTAQDIYYQYLYPKDNKWYTLFKVHFKNFNHDSTVTSDWYDMDFSNEPVFNEYKNIKFRAYARCMGKEGSDRISSAYTTVRIIF